MKLVFFILLTILGINYLLYFLVHEQEPDPLDQVYIEIAPAQKPQSTSKPTKPPHEHGTPEKPLKNPFGLTPARQMEIRNWILPIPDQETQETLLKAFMALFHEDRNQRNGKFAKESIDQILQKDPQNAVAYRLLGYFHISNGFRTQEAISAYQKAIELQPSYGEAHYALAFTLVTTDLATAEKYFVKAMELGVEDERNLADQFFKNVDMNAFRKTEKPIETEKLIETEKPIEIATNTLSLKEMTPSRQQEYQTYIQNISDTEIREALSAAFMTLFHPNKAQRNGPLAKENLDRVLQKDSQNAVAHRLMGYYHIDQGGFNLIKSMESYQYALQYNPNYGDVHYALAFSLAMSDLAEGEKHFIQAIELGIADERNLAGKFYKNVDIKALLEKIKSEKK
ncbi:MAG: tetratricopeptide repeat protein [Planctomycetota bacterium]